MSILKAKAEDLEGGKRGAPLPSVVYRATIESVAVEAAKKQGTQLVRVYGSLRTRDGNDEFALPDGTMYRIGNRKVFQRSWIDHPSEKATEIGNREILQEAVAAGIVRKPNKGETVELPHASFEVYAEELAGKSVLIRTKQRTRKDAAGKVKKDDEGQPIIDVEVAEYLTA